MSINKYLPHVWLIPEDDADRQLANGFLLHHSVDARKVYVRAPAGGWKKVLDVFLCEYVSLLRRYTDGHVIMLIDFDENEDRLTEFETKIPDDVRSRVFVVGSKDEPETLKGEFSMTLERIGGALAEDCLSGDFEFWRHPQLSHNESELKRLAQVVRPILFQ